MKPHHALAALFLTGLAACGGGGGNPGTCMASALTCAADRGQGGGSGTSTPPASVVGLWRGTTSNGRTAYSVVLPDGALWAIYSAVGKPTVIAGAAEGTYTASGTTLTSSDARDFNFEGLGISSATVTATEVPGASIAGTVAYPSGTKVTFTGTFDASFITSARTTDAAGTYKGTAAVAAGSDAVTLTVDANGGVTGTTAHSCAFAGTAAPLLTVNAFALSITFAGSTCSNGTATVTGVAVFDAASGQAVAAALNSARTDGFLFIGQKQ